MNVASQSLSEELFKLSGWDDTMYYRYERTDPKSTVELHLIGNSKMGMTVHNAQTGFYVDKYDQLVPAYDLGYLLRKLPHFIELIQLSGGYTPTGWRATKKSSQDYWHKGGPIDCDSNTPEDAAAKLATELFKQGILPTPQDYKET